MNCFHGASLVKDIESKEKWYAATRSETANRKKSPSRPQEGRQWPTSPSNRRGAFRERAAARRLVSGSHSAENAQCKTPRSPDFHKRGSYRAQRQAGLRHSPAEKGTKSVTAGQPTERLW